MEIHELAQLAERLQDVTNAAEHALLDELITNDNLRHELINHAPKPHNGQLHRLTITPQYGDPEHVVPFTRGADALKLAQSNIQYHDIHMEWTSDDREHWWLEGRLYPEYEMEYRK